MHSASDSVSAKSSETDEKSLKSFSPISEDDLELPYDGSDELAVRVSGTMGDGDNSNSWGLEFHEDDSPKEEASAKVEGNKHLDSKVM